MTQDAILFELLSSEQSEKTAVIVPDANLRVSYCCLRQQVEHLAQMLAALGVRRGDRVGLALPNGLPAIVGVLAASLISTAAPLNAAYREDEFRFYLEDTNARVLIVAHGHDEEARKAAGNRIPVIPITMAPNGLVTLEGCSGTQPFPFSTPEDVALILHTSGSTGRPKRVPLTHASLTISARNIARTYQLTPEDVSFCVMPLFHVHGLVASALSVFSSGGTVIVPTPFHPLSFWRTAEEHGVTWYSAVPTIHQLLLARSPRGKARPAGAERLRFIRSCSAPLALQMMHDLEEAFGAPVLEAYGMTEAAHQMASNPLPPEHRKPGSVGKATGVKVSIMDADGNHLASPEHGEVVVQGPSVICGYENNPEANATSFTDGWFRTGDQGYLDAEGYLTIVARKKELINRGGEKISPREVDEVLLTHHAVAEAVCFGFPHHMWGEEVGAAVVLKEQVSEKELLAYCRLHLADFKCPKCIYVTESIPRTATGKIQRRLVAQTYIEEA